MKHLKVAWKKDFSVCALKQGRGILYTYRHPPPEGDQDILPCGEFQRSYLFTLSDCNIETPTTVSLCKVQIIVSAP